MDVISPNSEDLTSVRRDKKPSFKNSFCECSEWNWHSVPGILSETMPSQRIISSCYFNETAHCVTLTPCTQTQKWWRHLLLLSLSMAEYASPADFSNTNASSNRFCFQTALLSTTSVLTESRSSIPSNYMNSHWSHMLNHNDPTFTPQ